MIGDMRKVLALQVVSAVLISAVLNVPALLILGGRGQAVAWAFVVLLLLLMAAGAISSRRRDGRNARQVVTGTVQIRESKDVLDSADFLARFRRRQRWARLQIPVLLSGLAIGSVLGAVLGGWWAEVLGGGLGYVVVVSAFSWLLVPRTLLTASLRPPRPGESGPG